MDTSDEGVSSMIQTARCYTNIALIKYWGKRDAKLNLPCNSSLSLTVDAFYTETVVLPKSQLVVDCFFLNGQQQSVVETSKVSTFLDLVYRSAGKVGKRPAAIIKSRNTVPTAAGLASSASGLSALTVAANLAYQLALSDRQLAICARQGSGSASRSLFADFVVWHRGKDSQTSYAESFYKATDYRLIFILLNRTRKKMSSRQAMTKTAMESCFFDAWVKTAEEDYQKIRKAIKAGDFKQVGQVMEANTCKMHATTLGMNEPFSYWQPSTLQAIERIKQLRQEGFDCYYTMDAGPNVKVLCRASQAAQIYQILANDYSVNDLILGKPGPGYQILEGDRFDEGND